MTPISSLCSCCNSWHMDRIAAKVKTIQTWCCYFVIWQLMAGSLHCSAADDPKRLHDVDLMSCGGLFITNITICM
jgi:predicted membrane protein